MCNAWRLKNSTGLNQAQHMCEGGGHRLGPWLLVAHSPTCYRVAALETRPQHPAAGAHNCCPPAAGDLALRRRRRRCCTRAVDAGRCRPYRRAGRSVITADKLTRGGAQWLRPPAQSVPVRAVRAAQGRPARRPKLCCRRNSLFYNPACPVLCLCACRRRFEGGGKNQACKRASLLHLGCRLGCF